MSKELITKVGEYENDGLIAMIDPPARAQTVTFAALTSGADPVTVKRGTVLGMNADGTVSVFGGTNVPAEEKFNGDGSAKTFTLTGKPKAVSGVKVGEDDAVIDEYNAYTGVVTLHTAPAAGTKNVVVSYEAETGAVPAYVLLDEKVELTEDANAIAVAYVSGCFNRAKIITAEGYNLTRKDEDELRQRDIFFRDVY